MKHPLSHRQLAARFLVVACATLAPLREPHEAHAAQRPGAGEPLALQVRESIVRRDTGEHSKDSPDVNRVQLIGTINGEAHWIISCQEEEGSRPFVPCTELEPGTYPATWVHNTRLLGVTVKGADEKEHLRFFDVRPDPGSPPTPQDSVQAIAPMPLSKFRADWWPVPKGRTLADYPLLIHIYASRSYGYTKFTLPGSSSCTATDTGGGTGQIRCTDYPAVPIHGALIGFFATLDGDNAEVSCTQGLWGNCAALPPGLYLARWKDSKRQQIKLVVPYKKPWEMTLKARMTPAQTDSSVGRPPEW